MPMHTPAKTIMLLLGILLLGWPWSLSAQENNPITYQQKKLMLVDSAGDEILVKLFFHTCETGIQKCRLRKNIAPQKSQLRQPRFSKENPLVSPRAPRKTDNTKAVALFDMQETVKNLKRILRDRKQRRKEISAGESHRWSNKHPFVISKIIVALGTASSSRFMYVGQEIPLIRWIAQCPDRSVTIEKLFQKSLELNNGNIYLTLLTIENVLSDASFEKDRENTLVNQKLADLYANSPNKFGDWYHLFGTILAGYVQEPAKAIANMYSVYRRISRGEQAEKSTMDADRKGADIGVQLRAFIEEETTPNFNLLLKQIAINNVMQKSLPYPF